MDRYDIAIIGTGPAGMEAAITAKIRNKNILFLGKKDLSNKIGNAHTIKNYLGLPEVSGNDMQEAFRKHLEALDISITEDKVNAVYAMGKYFAIQGHKDMYEASSVILACGVSTAKPFPGEMENLGRGVSYCATCDAALYRGRSAIVLAYSKDEEAEAEFLAEMAEQVYYLPMYKGDIALNEKIQIVSGKKPLSIQKANGKMQLLTENTAKNSTKDLTESAKELSTKDSTENSAENTVLEADGIFILRQDVAPSQLVPGLTMDGNHVAVDRSMKTNIAGLFACGDITGAPYQYIKAAGEGNVAALSAVSFLASK